MGTSEPPFHKGIQASLTPINSFWCTCALSFYHLDVLHFATKGLWHKAHEGVLEKKRGGILQLTTKVRQAGVQDFYQSTEDLPPFSEQQLPNWQMEQPRYQYRNFIAMSFDINKLRYNTILESSCNFLIAEIYKIQENLNEHFVS